MIVRKMLEQDTEAAARLEAASFSQPWSARDFLDALRNPAACYLTAEEDGQIVGVCGLWQGLDEGEVMNVSVDPAFRGRGIAFTLMRALEEAGTERGVRAFTLEVRESNRAAIALYEKCGYVSEGIRPNFYEKPKEHAVIMWKR